MNPLARSTFKWCVNIKVLRLGYVGHDFLPFTFNDAMILPGGVLTYLAEQGCAALMGRFFTRNP